MANDKNTPTNVGVLFNKKDTIIALIMLVLIAFLWFETSKFEKVPDLFSNNIPPEMFPQILLVIILGMALIIPFEHIFLKKSGKNIDSAS
jgi:phosphatidylserine synthase